MDSPDRIIDGVLYRIICCDDIEKFADRGLYLAVSTGIFYSNEAFNYDAVTGVITANKDFDGSSTVFDLPIDKSLADPEAADAYFASLTEEQEMPEMLMSSDDITLNFTDNQS
jgi:hypothetical protein